MYHSTPEASTVAHLSLTTLLAFQNSTSISLVAISLLQILFLLLAAAAATAALHISAAEREPMPRPITTQLVTTLLDREASTPSPLPACHHEIMHSDPDPDPVASNWSKGTKKM